MRPLHLGKIEHGHIKVQCFLTGKNPDLTMSTLVDLTKFGQWLVGHQENLVKALCQ